MNASVPTPPPPAKPLLDRVLRPLLQIVAGCALPFMLFYAAVPFGNSLAPFVLSELALAVVALFLLLSRRAIAFAIPAALFSSLLAMAFAACWGIIHLVK